VAEDILIHGHCHQKALYGINGLKIIFSKKGGTAKEIPSGCCGMAGSFGYEKEYYDI
jgi:Fe-S oxidoreductase